MYDTFKELGLVPEIMKAIEDMGFEEPTPIQKVSIPAAMEGKDLIGQAQTGTGKTAAFGIPILEKIDTTEKGPQAIVLSPTRELAIQSAEEMNRLFQDFPISSFPLKTSACPVLADSCIAYLWRTGYRKTISRASQEAEYYCGDTGSSYGPYEERNH